MAQAQPAETNVEADERPPSPADSAFVEGIGSSSFRTSLSESIKNYKYENGRRYHAYREGSYVVPNDEQEQERLDLAHHIYLLLLEGKLHRSPIINPQRVLDLGTGTGNWAVDFADEHPSAQVIGTDLSPIQPKWVPPNCVFEIDDYEDEWVYSHPFDFIHGRELLGSVSDFPRLFSQASKHLRSGAWFEIQSADPMFFSNHGTMEKAPNAKLWIEELRKASEQFGKSMAVIGTLDGEMINAGFVDVRRETRVVPIGTWPKDAKLKEIGKYQVPQLVEGVRSYTPALFSRVLGWNRKEIEVFCAAVATEIKDRSLQLYQEVHIIYGRKP